ncbi:MAG: DUF4925 domain-containing protein, partial [Muribaculaceae bacterium]|nr:DUF4925 domain-containing protein [Muribaculaceae bacterium]
MKKHLASALSLICAAVMITSCSNEKDPVIPGSSLESATFTTSENLVLTVDGVAATAQTASFTPSADGTASITLKGENLDLEGLFGAMSVSDDASALSFPTSCVIPGSAQASFTVTLSGSADKPTFTGSSETEYCTFAYSGEVSKDEMTLVLSDIKLKNTSLAATFSTGDFNDNFFNTLRVEWVSEKGIELAPNFEMPVKDILRVALALPLIPQGEDGNSVSVAAMIPELLKNVTFGADGSVTARYADTDEEGMPVKESPKGLARYVVKNDNTLLLFLDPQAIIANTLSVASKSRSVDFSTVLQGLMTQVVPMLVNGVPVNY